MFSACGCFDRIFRDRVFCEKWHSSADPRSVFVIDIDSGETTCVIDRSVSDRKREKRKKEEVGLGEIW